MITNPIIPIWAMAVVCVIISIIAKTKNKYSFLRRIIIISLLFVINLRIMIMSPDVQIEANNLDVLFVIDNTISMVAEDQKGNANRLEAVKKDAEYIINELNGAKFSVVTFNNTSNIVIPYITDSNLAMEAIDTIKVMDKLYAEGSSLNVALEDTVSLLETSKKKEDRKTIIFFISDGEITNEDTLKSFSDTKKYIDNGAVLGYGTTSGGEMQVEDILDEKMTYIEDRSVYPYVRALSKIDEGNLKEIAEDMGVDYIYMEEEKNINSKLKEIRQELLKTAGDEVKEAATDIYYIFVIPILGLLIYELINYKRRLLVWKKYLL